ncbi:hypothetical protein T492DRAFT_49068 [Pavlovales sp. CCMP2436]|nr:hypothetical protein T492DRAFT_49068 [Pavlovales sp. CCMP2436]
MITLRHLRAACSTSSYYLLFLFYLVFIYIIYVPFLTNPPPYFTQALKGCLLDLPRACNATSTSVYTKMVGSELGKAEQLLRLVLTPEHALAEHFSELAAGLAGVDLAKVLELKGVRRPEMTTSSLLEELKGGVSSSAANASLSQGSLKIKKLLNMN